MYMRVIVNLCMKTNIHDDFLLFFESFLQSGQYQNLEVGSFPVQGMTGETTETDTLDCLLSNRRMRAPLSRAQRTDATCPWPARIMLLFSAIIHGVSGFRLSLLE